MPEPSLHLGHSDSGPRWREAIRRDPRVGRIIDDAIVRRGLSYADAIGECERKAEEAAAPWLKAAELLYVELGDDRA